MVVATFLIALLSTLLALSWKAFGIPAVEVEARARLALSANLAASSLAQDLGGYQVRLEAKPGPVDVSPVTSKQVQIYRLYKFVGSLDRDTQHPYPLRLSFERENLPTESDSVHLTISYYVDSDTNTLVRLEEEL